MPAPTDDQIHWAIDDRMSNRWLAKLHKELAPPVAVIAVKQGAGTDRGMPVLCTLENMPNHMLADLLEGVVRSLRQAPEIS